MRLLCYCCWYKCTCSLLCLLCKCMLETTFFLFAATPTDCLLDNSRVVSIAMSFGFTVFVLVYVAAAFSGKLLAFTTSCAHVQHVLFSFGVVHPAVLLGSAELTEVYQQQQNQMGTICKSWFLLKVTIRDSKTKKNKKYLTLKVSTWLNSTIISCAPCHACMHCEEITITTVDDFYHACMQHEELYDASVMLYASMHISSHIWGNSLAQDTLYHCRWWTYDA